MANTLYHKHIISIPELSRDELELIVATAGELKARPNPTLLKNKVIASCFFEASTRTRLSFETAIQRLGGSVIGFPDGGNTSSGKKGETLADSVRVISSYVDGFVMRHPKEGAARLASEFSEGVPVVNGGDGANQHPTQTLLDLFSIYETQGRLDNLNIAMVGDLKYGRTVHSLTQALSKFEGNRFFYIAPDALAMPEHLLDELAAGGHPYSLHSSISDVVPELDVLYMTRVQKERFDESEYAHIKSAFILSAGMLRDAKPNMKVMHPLPRVDEITVDVDKTPHAYYFEQAENGVYAREALLALVLNEQVEGVAK
ncbi:aspartate carbamoyltransferase [Salinivibrio sp. MA351]|jgi:aspartate carbamoyltransferase (EC 2.1.3.2)|uniref:aspartate carbamoyltransferase n=1 Tax=Salinivibrio TaxID=51366 RepID=UPI00039565AA|nr:MULTISPECIES: aspartate carbamoyltransferase [Salinivibrio]NUY57245.1 aspartate carbamoyltransferase [Salinivibrio sp. EAGSL]OOE94338.1 aspartate carbamoyltransferase [Salinivibrio sp. AR647]OOF00345.1 aspartate carbamoyltransferase [Salinivibrio sp. IB643]OOF01442.1 aspartate carbamoyltransferase [Salinivibrio sp. MA351]OOF04368.1 aspartate carbamoyltransferase [Salinivibrio sp. MA440]